MSGLRSAALQRHGAGGAFAVEAGPLGLVSTGGRPLPDVVRGQMEAALGADFSGVRVHVGPQAGRIGAIAFTVGSDIYFAPGRYQPDSQQGQQLLGHELAHVVQQRQGRVRNPLGSGLAVVQDRALEAEADRLGQRAATHRVAAQAKFAPGAAQPSSPVQISPPIGTGAGPGSYRLTAGAGGREIGSVMVHARDKGALEVTDLSVAAAHRGQGIGQRLVASAARTGQQFGKSKVTLAAQDNGSGHLTRWYKGLGFAQVGVDRRGYPQLEAPISRVLRGAAQPKLPVFEAQPGKLAVQLFARSSTLQRAAAAALGAQGAMAAVPIAAAAPAAPAPLTNEELRQYIGESDLEQYGLSPAEQARVKELAEGHYREIAVGKQQVAANKKEAYALQNRVPAFKMVSFPWGEGKNGKSITYHINVSSAGGDHVTKEGVGGDREHYFFEGTGEQIKDMTSGQAGKKRFSGLPKDLQQFIKRNFTELLK